MPVKILCDLNMGILASFENIVVSGPQRSGTTFTARALSDTLCRDYVDEDEIKVRDERLILRALNRGGRKVIQAPGCSYCLHRLPGDSTAIVWVNRPLAEILRSQRRVSWNSGGVEVDQYRRILREGDSKVLLPVDAALLGCSASFKKWSWVSWQREACRAKTFEIDYHSDFLTGHRLHVDERGSFKARQWRL